MPNLLAKLLLLGLGAAYEVWTWFTARGRCAEREEAAKWSAALFRPAAVMIFALVANGMAFLQMKYVGWEIESMEEHFVSDGSMDQSRAPNRLDLLLGQISVLAGTALLFEIARRALHSELRKDDTPTIAALRVQQTVMRNLFRRHLWAVLGIGTVFGVAGGSGEVLFLALELLLMWVLSWIILRFMEKKRARKIPD